MTSQPSAKRRRHPSLAPLLNEVANATAGSDSNSFVMSTNSSKNRNNNNCNRTLSFASTDLSPERFASFDSESLRRYVDPIWRSLSNVDAETLLHLQRMEFGARLNDSTTIQPIHDDITPPRTDRGSYVVRYLHVGEIPGKYSVGIFVFPPNACIPLHDHPGMCVLSRVLYGDLQRTSMDLVPNLKSRSSWRSLLFPVSSSSKTSHQVANIRYDHLQAPDITMLFPREGNVHKFVAGPHGAAILDVLLPPYSGADQRDCTFYTMKEEQGGVYWIHATGQPEDFHCLSGSYRDFGET